VTPAPEEKTTQSTIWGGETVAKKRPKRAAHADGTPATADAIPDQAPAPRDYSPCTGDPIVTRMYVTTGLHAEMRTGPARNMTDSATLTIFTPRGYPLEWVEGRLLTQDLYLEIEQQVNAWLEDWQGTPRASDVLARFAAVREWAEAEGWA